MKPSRLAEAMSSMLIPGMTRYLNGYGSLMKRLTQHEDDGPDTFPSLCGHHRHEVSTTLYGVVCGIEIPDPRDEGDMAQRYEAAGLKPGDTPMWMMRAWCNVCDRWMEPLLDATGTRYLLEPS